MTKTNTIITIGRQFGSGGHEIGTKLAEYYGIKLYDKEMLAVAAKNSLNHKTKSLQIASSTPW